MFLKLKTHILMFTFLLTGCTTSTEDHHPDLSLNDLYELLEKQSSKGWNDQYVQDFIATHNETWPSLSLECWPEMTDAGLAGFHMIVVIKGNGAVADIRTDTPEYSAQCFRSELEKVIYPVPPEKYAYVIIVVGDVGDIEI